MNYYAVSVKPGTEKTFLSYAEKYLEKNEYNFIWPRRKLNIRKKGSWSNEILPIFPGYLFIRADEISFNLYKKIKKIPGFYRFLPNNQRISPLNDGDKSLLLHFLKFGEVIDKSIATFDEKNRIVIISGPLKGLEGTIKKVDKRKQRVKIRLDLFNESFLIDLGFETIKKLK